MYKFALLGFFSLLLSACSCNGQKPVNGPELECEPETIRAEFDEMYGAIGQAFDAIDVTDCEAAGRVANQWLDKYETRLKRAHQMDDLCAPSQGSNMKRETWLRYAQVTVVLDPPDCAPETTAGAAYLRYRELVGARDVEMSP
jgi:hypothetical protein